MGALFGRRKEPAIKEFNAPAPPPERSDSEIAALAAEQRSKYARTGRAQTMLTGGRGAGSGMTAVKYLGGAAAT